MAQAEADRPAVVAAATMAALQQQAAFARDVRHSDRVIRPTPRRACWAGSVYITANSNSTPRNNSAKDSTQYEVPEPSTGVAQEALSQDADTALRTPGAAQQVLAAVESATTPLESHPATSGAESPPKKAASESYSMPR